MNNDKRVAYMRRFASHIHVPILSRHTVYTVVPQSSCRVHPRPPILVPVHPRPSILVLVVSSSSFYCCVLAAKGLLPTDELSSPYPCRHLIVVLLPPTGSCLETSYTRRILVVI